jgi:hypothetical protein
MHSGLVSGDGDFTDIEMMDNRYDFFQQSPLNYVVSSLWSRGLPSLVGVGREAGQRMMHAIKRH